VVELKEVWSSFGCCWYLDSSPSSHVDLHLRILSSLSLDNESNKFVHVGAQTKEDDPKYTWQYDEHPEDWIKGSQRREVGESVGSEEGWKVGESVGSEEGWEVGESVGSEEGWNVGESVGSEEGWEVG